MSIKIKSALFSNIGKVRSRNEDNYYFAGKTFAGEDISPKTEHTSVAPRQLFAIFDGMGGEAHGDVASKIAAEKFSELSKEAKNRPLRAVDICQNLLDANGLVCDYMTANQTRQIGSTAAVVYVDEDRILAINVGDSRIYRFSRGNLKQISVDHTIGAKSGLKGGLTQHLGIPIAEMAIVPAQATESTKSRTRYLICSDGLTDLVPDAEIARVLKQESDVAKVTDILGRAALEAGAHDNITIILVEVVEAKSRRRLIRRLAATTLILGILTVGALVANKFITDLFVPKVAPTGIVLEQSSLNLTAGKTQKMSFEIFPSNAANREVVWRSDDEGVASVNDGVVQARGKGSTRITVRIVGTDIEYSCVVNVN